MTSSRAEKLASVTTLLLLLVVLSITVAFGQSAKLEGVIKGRSGSDIYLQTADSSKVIVLLTDSTDVAQFVGALKARNKKMSMAALVPGLPIQVEGTYNAENEMVASKIRFKGNDFEQAQAIQAGLHETQAQTQQNQAELERQNALLKEQNEALKQQQSQLTEQEQRIAANKAAIAANTARFGQLDDYYIWDELTVYFANGQIKVDPKYNSQLVALTQKAEGVNGHMIQVKGYASASGSASLNQKLSEQRAANVTNILLQQAHVPLSRMLAPGAMGENHQVKKAKTVDTEAENRRVVVRVLQNKGIAGLP